MIRRSTNQKCNRKLSNNACLRAMLFGLFAVILVSQPGCQIFGRFRSANRTRIPVAFDAQPTKADLIQHITEQSAKLGRLQSDVRVSLDGMPNLRGTLAIERPNRLRLKAGLLGVTEMGVDVGSNEDRFWVWSRASLPGQPPALFYANHSDYQQSGWKNLIPIEPQWLIDAIGLVSFNPADRHEGPIQRTDGRVEIRSFQTTARGTRTRKCAIDPRYGWVNQQAYYDSTGRLVAYTNALKHTYNAELGVALPAQVQLHVFQPNGQPLKMVVDISEFKPLYSNSQTMWQMPQPEDVQVVDLSKVSTEPLRQQGVVPPTQGRVPQNFRPQEWNRDSRRPLLPRIR